MGNNEGEKPSKPEKASSPPREQNNVHVYPDWAAVQAYYGPGAIPPPYFNPAVTSGQVAHPYMWAPPQMMPPYGSPYAAMYPHGGMYGPSPAPVVATPLSLETPTTRSSGNDTGSAKKPKEPAVHAASGNGKAESAGDAGNQVQSQSTDCGTEGSCDRSDDSTTREDNSDRSYNGVTASGTSHVQMVPYPGIDASAGNTIVPGIPMASGKPMGSNSMPTAEMNHSSHAKANANAVNTALVRPSGIGMQILNTSNSSKAVTPSSETLPRRSQDVDREMKREKRKQSNRESARRSRLRKQAEMEELGKKVDSLTVENVALRSEINKLVEDSEKIRSENARLMDKLKNLQGHAGEADSSRTNDQEKSHISTENLLSRVDYSASNGDHKRGDMLRLVVDALASETNKSSYVTVENGSARKKLQIQRKKLSTSEMVRNEEIEKEADDNKVEGSCLFESMGKEFEARITKLKGVVADMLHSNDKSYSYSNDKSSVVAENNAAH